MKHTIAVKHAIILPGEWSVCADIVVALIKPPQGAVIEKILRRDCLNSRGIIGFESLGKRRE